MKYDSWIVAAAVLIRKGHCLHYEELTREVLSSKLSTLGEKGTTPEQSMGAILRSRKEVFEPDGRKGYYCLRSKGSISTDPRIIAVLRELGKPQEPVN